jgi:hypothetical protein
MKEEEPRRILKFPSCLLSAIERCEDIQVVSMVLYSERQPYFLQVTQSLDALEMGF